MGSTLIAANLRKVGLTDTQIFRSFSDILDWRSRLSTAVAEKLKKLGAIKGDSPQWEVVETEYWQQSFPSKQNIEVEHSYSPLVDRFYDCCSTGDDFGVKKPLSGEDRNERVCLDDGSPSAVLKRISALFKPGENQVMVWLAEVEYTLGTGRNWKSPISDFTLFIGKATPDQIV